MFPVALWSIAGSILPHVRNPWPESIGLGFPFAMSGAFSMLVGVFSAEVSPERRDRLVNKAGSHGFLFGAAVYVLALLLQLSSKL